LSKKEEYTSDNFEQFDYLGFIYKIVDLKNSKTYIKYEWGKVPSDLNELKLKNNIYYDEFTNFHIEIKLLFYSLCNLVKFYYDLYELYSNEHVCINDYIPSFIIHILFYHYNKFPSKTNKLWLESTDEQKYILLEKYKDDLYKLFDICDLKNNKTINLLDENKKNRLYIVNELNNNTGLYKYPNQTLSISTRSRKFSYLKNKNYSCSKKQYDSFHIQFDIFNINNELLKHYDDINALLENFSKLSYSFKEFENENFIKIISYSKRKINRKDVCTIIKNEKCIFEIHSKKLLYELFGITDNCIKNMQTKHITYNGFSLVK
jgi:hypothetical protein